MQTPSWIHLDKAQNTIYINLNSEGGRIVKIAPGAAPEMVENGLGLVSSPSIAPFRYLPNAGEAEGFRALKALMDPAPLPIEQRYFLICWAISAFLLPYFPDRLLLQMFGRSGSGKSQTMARLSMFFNGDLFWGQTIAAAGRMAGTDPVIFMDNVDNRNLSVPLTDFLLFMANGAHKPKAKFGSGPELLFEKLNALCMITSIEPFPEKYPELINRTVNLTADRAFKKADYAADSVMKSVRADRDLMLSTIFKLIGRILWRLDRPGIEQPVYWVYLQNEYAGRHQRHLFILITILEALLEHLPLAGPAAHAMIQTDVIVDRWMKCIGDAAV